MKRDLLISPQISKNNFDVIRFLLSVSVIVSHCYVIYYGYDVFLKTEPFMVLSQKQISIGSVAVDFFFVISGFLIVKSFESSTTYSSYLFKRVLRIFPGFIVAFLISVLLVGPIGNMNDQTWAGYWNYLSSFPKKQELAHLFTLQQPNQIYYFKTMPQPGVNNSLWTIQYEFICYLLVPVFAFAGFLKDNRICLILFVVVYGLLLLQVAGFIFPFRENTNYFISNLYHYPRFVTYFLAGACVFLYRHVIPRSMILVLISLALIYLGFVSFKAVDWVLPLSGSYLLFYFAYHPRLNFSEFSKYGDLSYGIYLYGWPVQQLLMYLFWENLSPLRLFIISMPPVLILSYMSWHLIEKKFLNLKKKADQIPEKELVMAE